jgi:methionine sulfoxide reductase heme-binding subunit
MPWLRMSPLQWIVHAAALLLAGWLLFQALTGRLGVNPIQAATLRTGFYAITFLVLSLACTPLNSLFGFRQALKARRPLGVYAFLFALGHLLIFLWIDFGFNWEFLRPELVEKRYIWVGMSAFLILLPLALTSFNWWKRRLGKNWKRLHKLVYLAAPLAVVHFAWVRKGDILRLQGDIVQPLVYGLVVGLLLIFRIPAVRRSLARGRRRPSRPRPAVPGKRSFQDERRSSGSSNAR